MMFFCKQNPFTGDSASLLPSRFLSFSKEASAAISRSLVRPEQGEIITVPKTPVGKDFEKAHLQAEAQGVLNEVRGKVSKTLQGLQTQLGASEEELREQTEIKVLKKEIQLIGSDVLQIQNDHGQIVVRSEKGVHSYKCDEHGDLELDAEAELAETEKDQLLQVSPLIPNELQKTLSRYNQVAKRVHWSHEGMTRPGMSTAEPISQTDFSFRVRLHPGTSETQDTVEILDDAGNSVEIFRTLGDELQRFSIQASGTGKENLLDLQAFIAPCFDPKNPDKDLTPYETHFQLSLRSTEKGPTIMLDSRDELKQFGSYEFAGRPVYQMGAQIAFMEGRRLQIIPFDRHVESIQAEWEYGEYRVLQVGLQPHGVGLVFFDAGGKRQKSIPGLESSVIEAEAIYREDDDRSTLHWIEKKGDQFVMGSLKLPVQAEEGSYLLEEDVREELSSLSGRFRELFEKEELANDEALDALIELEESLKQYRPYESVKGSYRSVHAALQQTREVVREAYRLQAQREIAQRRLGEEKDRFHDQIDDLVLEAPDQSKTVGAHRDFLKRYDEVCAHFSKIVNSADMITDLDIHLFSREALERAEKDAEQYKEALALKILGEIGVLEEGQELFLHESQKGLNATMRQDSELFQHTKTGRAIMQRLQEVENDVEFDRITALKEELEKWGKFQSILAELEQQPERYFPAADSEIGARFRKAMNSCLNRRNTDGIGIEDVADFLPCHVLAFAEDIAQQAYRRNISEDSQQEFFAGLDRLKQRVNSVQDLGDASGLEKEVRAIRSSLRELKQKDYLAGNLHYLASASDALRDFEESLDGQLQKAEELLKDKIERVQGLKKRELIEALDSFEKDLETELTIHMRESDDEFFPKVRAAYALLDQHFRGIKLVERSMMVEVAVHQSLSAFVSRFDEYQDRFPEAQADIKGCWDRLKSIKKNASFLIDRLGIVSKKQGFAVLSIPEHSRQRMSQAINEELPDLEMPIGDDLKRLRLIPEVSLRAGRIFAEYRLAGDSGFTRRMAFLESRDRGDIAALHWESPYDGEDSAMSAFVEHYDGPQVAKEELVAYKVLKDLFEDKKRNKRFLKQLVGCIGRERISQLDEEIETRIDTQLHQMGIELSAHERRDVQQIFVAALAALPEEKRERKTLKNMNWDQFQKAAQGSFDTETLHSAHPSLNKEEGTLNWADFFERCDDFVDDFEETLLDIHEDIRRNTARLESQLVLESLNNQSKLPRNIMMSGLDAIRLRKLTDALEEIRVKKTKHGVLLLGDFGSGKTVNVQLLCELTNQFLSMVQGSMLQGIKNFDPGNVPADEVALRKELMKWNASLAGLKRSGILMLDEVQFVETALNALLDMLDDRKKVRVAPSLLGLDKHPDDVSIFDRSGEQQVTDNQMVPILTANASYNKLVADEMKIVDFILPEALNRRIAILNYDEIDERYELLWKENYALRGCADIDLPPHDLRTIISYRMPFGKDRIPEQHDFAAKDERLITDFSMNPDRLDEVVKLIDMRCYATDVIVHIQKASRESRRNGALLHKHGKPLCMMTAVGGGDVASMMPKIEAGMSLERVKKVIYEHLCGHLNDRGPEFAESNRLFLEATLGYWQEYRPTDWKNAQEAAERAKREGETLHPYSGPLRGMSIMLENIHGVFAERQSLLSAQEKQQLAENQKTLAALQKIAESIERSEDEKAAFKKLTEANPQLLEQTLSKLPEAIASFEVMTSKLQGSHDQQVAHLLEELNKTRQSFEKVMEELKPIIHMASTITSAMNTPSKPAVPEKKTSGLRPRPTRRMGGSGTLDLES